MDSDKQGRMSVTVAIFRDFVLGNTATNTAGFSSAKYIIFGWLLSNFRYFAHGHVQSLRNTLKPFSWLLLTHNPPPKKILGLTMKLHIKNLISQVTTIGR